LLLKIDVKPFMLERNQNNKIRQQKIKFKTL